MTPKEKADELVNKYDLELIDEINHFAVRKYASYKCAIIVCNEVLGYMGADRGYEFWTEVKKEVEKL